MTAPLTPEGALAEQRRIADRVERDRRIASSAAMPLGLFGVASLVAAVVMIAISPVAVGIYWSVVGPVGGLFLAWWYRKRELRLPFDGPPTAVMVYTAVTLVVGALVLGWSGDGMLAFFAVGSAYVLFAAASDNRSTFQVAVAILALTWVAQLDAWTGLTGVSESTRGAALSAAVGISQLAGAVAERRRTTGVATTAA
jgi:hypothetical protein